MQYVSKADAEYQDLVNVDNMVLLPLDKTGLTSDIYVGNKIHFDDPIVKINYRGVWLSINPTKGIDDTIRSYELSFNDAFMLNEPFKYVMERRELFEDFYNYNSNFSSSTLLGKLREYDKELEQEEEEIEAKKEEALKKKKSSKSSTKSKAKKETEKKSTSKKKSASKKTASEEK